MYRLRAPRLLAIVAIAVGCLGSAPGPVETASVVLVGSGGDLQKALDAAQPGDVIQLQAGARFVGNFVLPARRGDDTRYITLRSSVPDADVPGDSTRISTQDAPLLPKLRSPNGDPALRTAPGARHWRVLLVEFEGNPGGSGEIIRLGEGGTPQSPATLPEDLVIDRCYIHGDPAAGQKRGIALNSGDTRILNSLVLEIKAEGQDSQAIGGWNGPGPYTILNNRLEGGQAIMFGGADPRTADLVPTDIWIRGNHLTRPPALRGSRWQVKNLFELKNARDVRVEGNLMEYHWSGAQPGYAVVLTPRNQEGGAPWSTVENVWVRFNVIRHVGAAFNLLGRDSPNASGTARGITIADNLLYDVDGAAWGGNGEFLRVGDGPSQVTVEHNTVLQTGNVVSAYGGPRDRPTPIGGFSFRFNVVRHNEYGVHGSDRGVGSDTLNAYFPGAVFTGNLLAGGQERLYPPGNLFPPADDFERLFVDAAAGDFRLAPDARAPSDEAGFRAGADIAEVNLAWRGAQQGNQVRLKRAPVPERERALERKLMRRPGR